MMEPITTKTNWAVRVPGSLESSHDILPSSPNLFEMSPSPFAIKICTLRGSFATIGSPQALYYVTKTAAQDRASGKLASNVDDVTAGWYMVGVEKSFHIHAGLVKQGEYGERSENGITVTLKVDGQDTEKHPMYRKKGNVLTGPPAKFTGFLKKALTPAGSRVATARIDLFSFEKVLDASEEKKHTPTDYGTISMHIGAGVLYKQKVYDSPRFSIYDCQKEEISAKTVAREGRTFRVGSSDFKMQRMKFSEWGVGCQRELEEARITVSVRSESWLRSRLIIDENNQPYKHIDFLRAKLACACSTTMKRGPVLRNIVNNVEEPRKKRKSAKKENSSQAAASEEQSVEVINLS